MSTDTAHDHDEAHDGEEGHVHRLNLSVDIKDAGPCMKHVRVTVPRADIEHYYGHAVENLADTAAVPGRHHRLADHREGLLADLVSRLQEVRPVEPDPAHVIAGDEPVDVDRPRALEAHRLELLLFEDHEAIVLDLLPLGLIVLGDGLAGLGVDILALDAVAGLPVDRVETQRLAGGPRRLHRHRAGDE